MTETVENITVTGEGLTVSRLIWNRFQRSNPDALARIYDLNPNLAALGTILPVGTIVKVPVSDRSDTEKIVESVTLW